MSRANHHLNLSTITTHSAFSGYEFLEPLDQAPGFRTGLNFASFQDTPERLFRMLTQSTWLGGTNLVSENDKNPLPGMDWFLSVRAAAIF